VLSQLDYMQHTDYKVEIHQDLLAYQDFLVGNTFHHLRIVPRLDILPTVTPGAGIP